MQANYSLYLVTDSSGPILGVKDLVQVVSQAIQGGATIVQYRDKTACSRELQATAERLHKVTRKYGVPLIVNDRIDIALAVGAEGVHLGQDDMDLASARHILGPQAIIGVTCATPREAEEAVIGGADYLGIGTVFATPTKIDTKHVIGTAGTRAILERLSTLADLPKRPATVAIGGINTSNVQRVMFQSKAPFRALDGVAVVSAIMSADDPKKAAGDLCSLLQRPPAFVVDRKGESLIEDPQELVANVSQISKRVIQTGPLSHNMINQVVINFAANVALATGARPIMSHDGGEASDLALLGGCLVINMGTVQPQTLRDYLQALQAYNSNGGPVLFDPVGAGATKLRRESVRQLMAGGYFDIIKGNESEIGVIFGGNEVQQKGVDSSRSTFSEKEKASLTRRLARRERNVVVMTGEVDYLSDGDRTYVIRNGHEYLGQVTGTGCTLGTTIASFAAVERRDKLLAALAAMLLFEIAAELAASKSEVRGPGTFVPAFLDSLRELSTRCESGDGAWLSMARVEKMEV